MLRATEDLPRLWCTCQRSRDALYEIHATEADLAYTAGLVDGEGHVGLFKWGSSFLPILVVTNTDERLPNWLQAHFGGELQYHDRRRSEIHKPRINWRLNGKRATSVLKLVLPYLVLKGEQARLAISYYTGQTSFHLGSRKLPETEYERRKQLHDQMKQLNKRGTI